MRILSFVLVLALQINRLLAQNKIEVFYEADNQGDYQFYCTNTDYCTYALEVTFTNLSNLKSTAPLPYRGTVRPGRNSLFKLQKENDTSPINFNYQINYQKGCVKPAIHANFAYLIPIREGKKAEVFELPYLGKQYGGESEPKDFYAVGFKMSAGDTVFAARRGIVTEVKNKTIQNGNAVLYQKEDNYIEIYHADCSFATYRVLKENAILVKPGQWVEAGMPIGIVGGEKYTMGPHLQFLVHYNHQESVVVNGKPSDKKHYWAYVPIRFWIKEGTTTKLEKGQFYTAEHPEALITQEMSKREVKNRQKILATYAK